MKYRRKGFFENGSYVSAAVLSVAMFLLWSGPAHGLEQVTGDTVTLAWDPSEGATGYVVLYAPYPHGEPIERLDVGNQTEVTLNVWEGAAFYLGVQAYKEDTVSDLSEIVTFMVTGGRPSPFKLMDVSVRGMDGFAGLSSEESADVSVQLDPGDLEGEYRDAWIAAETPFGLFSYVDQIGWMAGIHRYSQFPLTPIPSLQVLNLALPPGKYAFYFAVDQNWDAIPDGTWFDSVEVEIRGAPGDV